jgi:16S rRNA (guanine527-N7)-methyltransferase
VESDQAGRDPSSESAVPRETAQAPAAPPEAETLLGDHLPSLVRYADLLADAGVARGLIGPREVPRLWERHLLNCAVVADLFAPGSELVDVGSGAGLPGLVLAICRPDLHLVLAEPLLRRTTFLNEAVAALSLGNVRVERVRAEQMAGAVDAVTARAVAPLDRLARWTLPLLRPGGQLVALKGASAGAELQAALPVLEGLGARHWEVLELEVAPGFVPTRAVVVVAGRAVREGGPRRSAGAGKRRRA